MTHRADNARVPRAGRGAGAVLALAALAVAAAILAVAAPAAFALERGIVDNRLEIVTGVDPAEIPALTAEVGSGDLGAHWTRVLVHWARLQPQAPGTSYAGDADGDGYDDAYVAELRAIVAGLRAAGVTPIMTPTEVPRWASDSSLWDSPPPGFSKGYSVCYAMRAGDPAVLAAFGKLGAFIATGLGSPVKYLECWNEPNTGGTFYPQMTGSDPWFGPRTYLKMLRAFHTAVRAAEPDAVVIAGATAPRGGNDTYSLAPQVFATYLHDHGAARYFEAYSHHPYCWGPPDVLPRDQRRTVWLANLGTLTKLFPTTPFYLTEYGYGTDGPALVGMEVTQARQAAYLREGYSYVAARYPKVRALLWFMVRDLAPTSERLGAYMGLSTVAGVRKLSYYAFIGGNRVSLTTPTTVRTRKPFVLQGTLASARDGGLAGKSLLLQRRAPGRAAWTVAARGKTAVAGAYTFTTAQPKGVWSYRVLWDGVCQSATRKVRAR